MKFIKRSDDTGVYTAVGSRGEWRIAPFEAKRGGTLSLFLDRQGEKPRLFGFYLTRDEAETEAALYDKRGN